MAGFRLYHLAYANESDLSSVFIKPAGYSAVILQALSFFQPCSIVGALYFFNTLFAISTAHLLFPVRVQ